MYMWATYVPTSLHIYHFWVTHSASMHIAQETGIQSNTIWEARAWYGTLAILKECRAHVSDWTYHLHYIIHGGQPMSIARSVMARSWYTNVYNTPSILFPVALKMLNIIGRKLMQHTPECDVQIQDMVLTAYATFYPSLGSCSHLWAIWPGNFCCFLKAAIIPWCTKLISILLQGCRKNDILTCRILPPCACVCLHASGIEHVPYCAAATISVDSLVPSNELILQRINAGLTILLWSEHTFDLQILTHTSSPWYILRPSQSCHSQHYVAVPAVSCMFISGAIRAKLFSSFIFHAGWVFCTEMRNAFGMTDAHTPCTYWNLRISVHDPIDLQHQGTGHKVLSPIHLIYSELMSHYVFHINPSAWEWIMTSFYTRPSPHPHLDIHRGHNIKNSFAAIHCPAWYNISLLVKPTISIPIQENTLV